MESVCAKSPDLREVRMWRTMEGGQRVLLDAELERWAAEAATSVGLAPPPALKRLTLRQRSGHDVASRTHTSSYWEAQMGQQSARGGQLQPSVATLPPTITRSAAVTLLAACFVPSRRSASVPSTPSYVGTKSGILYYDVGAHKKPSVTRDDGTPVTATYTLRARGFDGPVVESSSVQFVLGDRHKEHPNLDLFFWGADIS